MFMKGEPEAMSLTNLILPILNLLALKLDNRSATHADHVIMMPFDAGALKKVPVPLAGRLLENPAFQEKRERPVNRIEGHPNTLLFEPPVKTLGVEMVPER